MKIQFAVYIGVKTEGQTIEVEAENEEEARKKIMLVKLTTIESHRHPALQISQLIRRNTTENDVQEGESYGS